MARSLVIVESPAKARTISRFLGPDFVVESSIGHIRDLPSGAAEVPARFKGQAWARLGVDVDGGFKPLYVIPNEKKAQVRKLKAQLREATELYLATDEDREGEAIAWHLLEVLGPTCPVNRMVFHEITLRAIEEALESTREIDQRLVNAQETRRILDRLVGYEVSPVLWRKVRPKLSAGRVQSVATRLLVERERFRMVFVEAEYCGLEAHLEAQAAGQGATAGGPASKTFSPVFTAKLAELGGQRVAVGKDFDNATGELKQPSGSKAVPVVRLDRKAVDSLLERLKGRELRVTEVTEKQVTYRPYAPFITSTLQQEAARKLRFNAQRTMRVAQSLYENGYITYMRTDSTTLSGQAINAARQQVVELYGDEYLPDQPRRYSTSSRSAQEAHEAIRPAGESFRTPRSVRGGLDSDQYKLYELIWTRTLACQMKDARGLRTNVHIQGDAGEQGLATFTTSGKVLTFPGFLRAYVEGSDDPSAELADQEKMLPPLAQGQLLAAEKVVPTTHTTQPPPRFTEASLVKELEARGIGRPSTYATIIQTIQDRGYSWHKGPALVPTFTAFAVVNLLEQHLPDLVDYDFTAKMETGLDSIASGEAEPVPWLSDFYFGSDRSGGNELEIARVGLKALIGATGEAIDARKVSQILIGRTDEGDEVVVRVGRYGPYLQIGDSDRRTSVPDDLAPDELTPLRALELIELAAKGDRVLGKDPETGKQVYLKTGRFGPYVQLGDPELTDKGTVKRGTKPKMASLWPSMTVDSITLDDALMLLSFPREIGKHPQSGEPITVQDGRFGPYVKMGTESRSLQGHEEMATLTLTAALELLAKPKGARRQASAVLAELGTHPANGGTIQVKTGRFGPYVTDGTVNATIPKDREPESVSLEDAVQLLDAREQRLRDQGKDPRAPKPARRGRKTAATKSAGAKKTKSAGAKKATRSGTGSKKTSSSKTKGSTRSSKAKKT